MEKRIKKLEADMKLLANHLQSTIILTNLLIRKAKLNEQDIKAAFIEASLEYAETERIRSEKAGTPINRDGYGQSDLLRTESSGDASLRSITTPKESHSEPSNGDLPSGDVSDDVGGAKE